MSNRAAIKFTDLHTNTVSEYGTNLGDLGPVLRKCKGDRLIRESTDLINRATFRIYGPKTYFCITAKEPGDQGFKLHGFIMKPMHGKEGIFERLGEKEHILEISLAQDEAAE